jgi:hypothetical protein
MSKAEVYSKLQNMKDIQTNSIQMKPTYKPFWQEGISWSFTGTVETNGGIYFHNDKVVMMHFSEADNLPISAFIEKFGEPQQIWITRSTLDGIMLDISFMYPQQGICFDHPPTLFSQYSDNYSIHSGAKIRDVYYFDPAIAIASLDQFNVGCLWSIEAETIQVWKGYGEYRIFDLYK